jgi:Alpha amylase, catalytic domain
MEGKPEAKVEGITEALAQSDSIDGHMLRFLENHDEQRIASSTFSGDARAAIPGMTVTTLLGSGPVLIYFGQESGEKGEGAEGFGGEDGRTTIFDYWGVPAHQAWVNGGKYDGGALDAGQKELRDFYRQLMHLAQNPAIVQGERIIVPAQEPGVYAFIRYVAGDSKVDPILVVVNFGREDVTANLKYQDWAKIGCADFEKVELQPKMSFAALAQAADRSVLLRLTASGLSLSLPGWGAQVYALEQDVK